MEMPATGPPGWDPYDPRRSASPRAGASAAARRRRRRRRWRQGMLWLLTLITTGVLLLIAGFVRQVSKTPTVARPAALTATAHGTRHAAPSPASRRAPSRTVPEVTDASSGLSYQLLSSPWRR